MITMPTDPQPRLFESFEIRRGAKVLKGRPMGPLYELANLELHAPPEPEADSPELEISSDELATPASADADAPHIAQDGAPAREECQDAQKPVLVGPECATGVPHGLAPTSGATDGPDLAQIRAQYEARCQAAGKWPRADWDLHPDRLLAEGYDALAYHIMKGWLVPWNPPGRRYNHRLAARHAKKKAAQRRAG